MKYDPSSPNNNNRVSPLVTSYALDLYFNGSSIYPDCGTVSQENGVTVSGSYYVCQDADLGSGGAGFSMSLPFAVPADGKTFQVENCSLTITTPKSVGSGQYNNEWYFGSTSCIDQKGSGEYVEGCIEWILTKVGGKYVYQFGGYMAQLPNGRYVTCGGIYAYHP